MVVVPVVRTGIQDSSMTPDSAVTQLDSAGKQIPLGQVRLDLDRAAFDLSQFNLRAAYGEAAGKWANRFAADLDRITRECQPR